MAKKLKMKLPKRIAGVKIPKAVRKGPVGEFLNSGAGQMIVAEAVAAVAAMFAVSRADDDSAVRHPVTGARRLGHLLSDSGLDQTARLSYAFKAAGRAFREALHDDAVVWDEEPEVHTEARSKKKSSTRSSSRTSH